MHFSSTLLAFLASASLASATFGHGIKFSWECDKDTRDKAPQPVKNDCSGRGDFFTHFLGKAVCCSDKTRVPPPKDDDCPHNWAWNKRVKCCIPPKPVCEKDCGEGYVFNKVTMRCDRKEVNKCGKGQWWHDRNKECCDFDWSWDRGTCPKGKKCPTKWHWSKKYNRCKPDTPRTPEPDCDDWNDHNGCCGGPPPPGPSPKPGKFRSYTASLDQADVQVHPIPAPPTPPHAGGPKNPAGPGPKPAGPPAGGPQPAGPPAAPGHPKRNTHARRTQIAFPKSEIDEMYCPDVLHACSINTVVGGEWAYECIDFATELESCGGCASTGDGQDCTKIPHAISVGCDFGTCIVNTCQQGFVANGTSCVTP